MINHLWQSTVFAAVGGLLAFALRKNRAHVRYWIWFVVSIKFLVPFSLLAGLGSSLHWAPAAAVSATSFRARTVDSLIDIARPFPTPPLVLMPSNHVDRVPMAVISAWALGFAAIVLLRLRDWLRIRSAVRASSPLDISATITVRSSPGWLEPGVVGVFRPVLLVPAGIEVRLTRPQLEAVLAHEICHLLRRDNLTSTIHMIVESLFWFHPLVWWIGARLIEEREFACDEEVLRQGSAPRVYAEGILNVCKLYVESRLACVSGVTGSSIKKRIEAIISNRIALKLNLAKKLALIIAGAGVLLGPIAIGAMNAPHLRALSVFQPHAADPAVVSAPLIPHEGGAKAPAPRVIAQQAVPPPGPAPKPPEESVVILIIDRSSSMEGEKMEMARKAASAVVENLSALDTVGVLAFANGFDWVVTPRHADDPATMNQLIAAIQPDGGTQIAPALTEAYSRTLSLSATYKHVVLLTDGISQEGDSMDLARSANSSKITISTVGLGPDVNRGYLERIAELAGGNSYFLTDPQGLEEILIRDVQEHTSFPPEKKPN